MWPRMWLPIGDGHNLTFFVLNFMPYALLHRSATSFISFAQIRHEVSEFRFSLPYCHYFVPYTITYWLHVSILRTVNKTIINVNNRSSSDEFSTQCVTFVWGNICYIMNFYYFGYTKRRNSLFHIYCVPRWTSVTLQRRWQWWGQIFSYRKLNCYECGQNRVTWHADIWRSVTNWGCKP